MYRTVEQPRGRGRLVGEDTEANVSYKLRVMQEMVKVGNLDDPGATIPGLQSVDGTVEFEDQTQEDKLVGGKLTLHLEDGRRLPVILTGSGHITGTGGFFKS